MTARTLVLWLAPIVWCGVGGYMLSVHMDVVERRVDAEVMQAYSSVSNGHYEQIRADWLRRPKSIEHFKELDRRYGKPVSCQVRQTFADFAGTSFEGEVLVKRKVIDTVESFDFGGFKGIAQRLADPFPKEDSTGPPLQTKDAALAIAKPILHEWDWAMNIKSVTAEKIGDEWRIACTGTENRKPQTRFLILSAQGQPIEHVRAHLADYPPQMVSQ